MNLLVGCVKTLEVASAGVGNKFVRAELNSGHNGDTPLIKYSV